MAAKAPAIMFMSSLWKEKPGGKNGVKSVTNYTGILFVFISKKQKNFPKVSAREFPLGFTGQNGVFMWPVLASKKSMELRTGL